MPIAVDQQPSAGSDYPFLYNGPICDFVLHFYLSYPDSKNVFAGHFELSLVVTGSDFTLTVTDEDANEIIELESTAATTSDWGSDRRTWSWVSGKTVVSITMLHADVVTANGILDPRTCNKLPKRVESLKIGDQTFTGDVIITSGYNIDAVTSKTVTKDGGTYSPIIDISGIPGAGIGKLPGCEDTEVYITSISNVKPDSTGNFKIIADDCVRIQEPLEVTDGFPRTAIRAHAGYTNEEAKAFLKLYDDCSPCCDCDYFVWVYRGLVNMWNYWKEIGTSLSNSRDIYIENLARWNDAKDRIETNPIKLSTVQEAGCTTFIGCLFGNATACCLTDIEIRITLRRFRNGAELLTVPVAELQAAWIVVPNDGNDQAYYPDIYTDSDGWPVYVFRFDYVSSQDSITAKMRLYVECAATDSLQVTGSVHFNSVPENCTAPELTDSELEAIWTAYSVPPNTLRFKKTNVVPLTP